MLKRISLIIGLVFVLSLFAVGLALAATAPTITDIAPSSGAYLSTATITGTDFGVEDVNCGVILTNGTNQYYGLIQSWSDTLVSFKVPNAPAGNYVVTVENDYGPSNGLNFEVVSLPIVTSYTPNKCATGAPFTINGSAFTGATSVEMVSPYSTNYLSFTVIDDNKISAVVPSTALLGNYYIYVTTPAGKSLNQVVLTVGAQPVITSVRAYIGTGGPGSKLSVMGTNLASSSLSIPCTARFRSVTDPTVEIPATVQKTASSTKVYVTVPSTAIRGKQYYVIVNNGVLDSAATTASIWTVK